MIYYVFLQFIFISIQNYFDMSFKISDAKLGCMACMLNKKRKISKLVPVSVYYFLKFLNVMRFSFPDYIFQQYMLLCTCVWERERELFMCLHFFCFLYGINKICSSFWLNWKRFFINTFKECYYDKLTQKIMHVEIIFKLSLRF